MESPPKATIYYKRARFLAHLPQDCLYTRSHGWLAQIQPGVWRVGLTTFASRMLGDMVEFGFGAKAGDQVAIGQGIGWLEGFKAVSDIYSVAAGEFLRSNPAIESDITLVDSKPFGDGWLYEVRGEPDPESFDVHGYINLLDTTVDKMLASRHDGSKDG